MENLTLNNFKAYHRNALVTLIGISVCATGWKIVNPDQSRGCSVALSQKNQTSILIRNIFDMNIRSVKHSLEFIFIVVCRQRLLVCFLDTQTQMMTQKLY